MDPYQKEKSNLCNKSQVTRPLPLMGRRRVQLFDEKSDGFFSVSCLGFQSEDRCYQFGGLFASISQMGLGVGVQPSDPSDSRDNGDTKLPFNELFIKYQGKDEVVKERVDGKKRKGGISLKLKIKNPSLRRLFSGAIAGAVSRTAVAPLETIRTLMMVGNSDHSTTEVFHNIVKTDGWKGLFRGNFVNVIRVAPSKAIELFTFDTVNKNLSPKPGEESKFPIPASLIAGACAGVTSTICTYPLELVKTRLTVQRDVYDGLLHAFLKIIRDEGPAELYSGLTASLIGVVPYAAANYYAYDTLKKAYKKVFKQEKVGNIETLLIGSVAGAISSSSTFPMEVARKQMQLGTLSGRQVYKNMFHALACILEQEGIQGLYRGLVPSCMKLIPAAGISFMCYEACKRIFLEDDEED
ncbi:adenine nucleotide transporter BT1, chloroplastic/mitochondrial [Vigna radiata var. radiata]|uniref:Adenine nucleotide transporter BT1, chloroplastic/mitochondrial n=1 Tax=Vigna radiata var. radiata TaxID=3916 RepID=A0A1S3TXA2_VIGRR|nr:adenine nucleotide transporter BT1, chloroplastic/mitochondrial [Vigna radiata var. radiata]